MNMNGSHWHTSIRKLKGPTRYPYDLALTSGTDLFKERIREINYSTCCQMSSPSSIGLFSPTKLFDFSRPFDAIFTFYVTHPSRASLMMWIPKFYIFFRTHKNFSFNANVFLRSSYWRFDQRIRFQQENAKTLTFFTLSQNA